MALLYCPERDCDCRECREADANAERLDALKADDSEVADAHACADFSTLDPLMVAAYRTGDWAAYTAELARQLTRELERRAAA